MRCTICLPALFLSALTAQETVERTYDLSELVRPLPGITRNFDRPLLLLPSGRVLARERRNEFSFLPGGEARPEPIAAPWLPQKLLVPWLEHLWDQERGVGKVFDQTLTLRAPMPVQTEVQDVLTLLEWGGPCRRSRPSTSATRISAPSIRRRSPGPTSSAPSPSTATAGRSRTSGPTPRLRVSGRWC